MVTENYTEFWGTDNWGRPYGYLDRIYAGGWHRGHDLLGAEWGKRPVPILRSGKVVYSAKAPYGKLGHVVVIRTENGDYDSYCHVVLLRKIKIGDKLVEGDETAIRLARWGETTGTSWTGPHLHLVRSRMLDAAWNTYRSVQDPRPVIRTQLAQAAVDDKPKPLPPAPKPTPAPEPEEEDDMDFKPTVHKNLDSGEYMLAHPGIGTDLEQFFENSKNHRKDGKVTVYRGFMVTGDAATGAAWARMYAKGVGAETSRTKRADYIKIQEAASQLSVQLTV